MANSREILPIWVVLKRKIKFNLQFQYIYFGDEFKDVFDGHKEYVMLGAIQDGSADIELLAAIAWDHFVVHTPQNQTKKVNEAEWYINGGSLGFAPLDSSIRQNNADVEASGLFSGSVIDSTTPLRLG